MKINKIVSEFDNQIYSIIRKNVKEFLKQQANIYDSENLILLDIAPQNHNGAREYFNKSKIFTADINPKSGANYIVDICQNNSAIIDDNKFDIVICTEVLEHTLNPFNAINEIYRITKKDGVLLLSTPFNFRIHGPLPDCWRFTEHGLRYLLNNFATIEIFELEDNHRFLMPLHYTVIAKK
jgi:ubiquinone/menaquinone biosynthesis C-methylase UbiE